MDKCVGRFHFWGLWNSTARTWNSLRDFKKNNRSIIAIEFSHFRTSSVSSHYTFSNRSSLSSQHIFRLSGGIAHYHTKVAYHTIVLGASYLQPLSPPPTATITFSCMSIQNMYNGRFFSDRDGPCTKRKRQDIDCSALNCGASDTQRDYEDASSLRSFSPQVEIFYPCRPIQRNKSISSSLSDGSIHVSSFLVLDESEHVRDRGEMATRSYFKSRVMSSWGWFVPGDK